MGNSSWAARECGEGAVPNVATSAVQVNTQTAVQGLQKERARRAGHVLQGSSAWDVAKTPPAAVRMQSHPNPARPTLTAPRERTRMNASNVQATQAPRVPARRNASTSPPPLARLVQLPAMAMPIPTTPCPTSVSPPCSRPGLHGGYTTSRTTTNPPTSGQNPGVSKPRQSSLMNTE